LLFNLLVAIQSDRAAAFVTGPERHRMDDALDRPGHYDAIGTAFLLFDAGATRGVDCVRHLFLLVLLNFPSQGFVFFV